MLPSINETVKAEYAAVEPDLGVSMRNIPYQKNLWMKKLKGDLVNALYAIPHGVIKMSNDIPGLVETSTNLAVVET